MSQASPVKRSASPSPGAAAGRPRSTDVTLSVRAAALALAQEGGAPFATVERIAERSGVAKNTIYRRWPNAASIVMDAFLVDIDSRISRPRKASLEENFIAMVQQLVAALQGARGDLLRHLIGAAQSDPQLLRAVQENWIRPCRAAAMAAIAEAQAKGKLAANVDANALVDTIYGAVYYRLMIPYQELSAVYVRRMVRQVFRGISRPKVP